MAEGFFSNYRPGDPFEPSPSRPAERPTPPGRGIKEWIQVFSGAKFFPLAPAVEDVHLSDIARALSMLCRYGGHVARFYSVAEHSCRVSDLVLQRTSDPRQALWGLLHDASEAYIADVTRPVKHQPAMQPYRDAEKRLQNVICDAFDLPREEPAAVTQADYDLLGTEAVQLKSPIHPDWAKTTSNGQLPEPMNLGRLGWSPGDAETSFLRRFRRLTTQIAGSFDANGSPA